MDMFSGPFRVRLPQHALAHLAVIAVTEIRIRSCDDFAPNIN